MEFFWIYLCIINILGFMIWCLDKYCAKKGYRRISEKTLALFALIGGSFGCLCAMELIRHKTRHWYFKIGLPLLTAAQAVLILWWIKP